MAAAAERLHHHPTTADYTPSLPETETPEQRNSAALADHISYLDRFASIEGLSEDWWTLRYKVGFSMQKQMDLLPPVLTPKGVDLWLKQTTKDMKAYALEYLKSDSHAAYSSLFDITPRPDGTHDLIDVTYQKDMLAVISDEERSGTVKESYRSIRSFFLNERTPPGSLAVMISPKGDTGMTYDDGTPKPPYVYSYLFIGEKVDDKTVKTYGIKTDFSLRECRETIYALTGTMLPFNAPVEEYVRAIALLPQTPYSAYRKTTDIVTVLQRVRGRFDPNPAHACEQITWDMIRSDIAKAEALYDSIFDQTSRNHLAELPKYIVNLFPDRVDRLSIQKGVAATVLRLTEHFLQEKQTQTGQTYCDVPQQDIVYDRISSLRIMPMRYGDVMEQAETLPGCNGGGSRSKQNDPLQRSLSFAEFLGFESEESYSFDQKATCRACGEYREDCGPCNICKSCDEKIKREAMFR